MGYIASYGYAAPISENGLPNPTKYVQTALLARALARYSSTIINSDYAWPLPLHNLSSSAPSNPSTLYSYTIGALGRNGSVVFLFNRHLSADGDVEVGGKRFRIPYWTLLLIDGLSLDVVYDSNTDSDPQYPMPWVDEAVQRRLFALRSLPSAVTYQPEPVGVQRVDAVTTQPLDQLMLVGYQSSYLVYSVNVSVTAEQVRRGAVTLTVTAANDFLFVWLGDAFQLSHPLIDSPTRLTLNTSGLSPGSCVLTLVTCAMGVDNYTPDPTKHKGLAGANVSLDSDLLTDGHHSWRHQRGLSLERRLSTRAQETWAPLPPIPPRLGVVPADADHAGGAGRDARGGAAHPHVSAESDADGERLSVGQRARGESVLAGAGAGGPVSGRLQSDVDEGVGRPGAAMPDGVWRLLPARAVPRAGRLAECSR